MSAAKPLSTNTPKQRRQVMNAAARWLSLDASVLFDSFKVRAHGHPAYGRIDTSDAEGRGINSEIQRRRELAAALRRIAKEIQK